MFKVINKDTGTKPIGAVLVSLLLTLKYFTPCSSVSIVNLEHVNTGIERAFCCYLLRHKYLLLIVFRMTLLLQNIYVMISFYLRFN